MADLEDENRGPKILGVLWGLTALTTLVVVARIFIRTRMLKNFGSDDWLIALSMVSMFLFHRTLFVADESVHGSCLLQCHHGECPCGLWQTRCLSEPGCAGDGHLAQYHQLCVWDPVVCSAQAGCQRHVDSHPQSQSHQSHHSLVFDGTCGNYICHLHFNSFHHVRSTQGSVENRTAAAGGYMQRLVDSCQLRHFYWRYASCPTGPVEANWIALSAFVDLYLAIYPTTVLLNLHMSLRKRLALSAALGLGSM